MQGLCAAQCRCHCFYSGADNIIIRVLFGQACPGCLAMGAQHQGFLIAGLKQLFHPARPQGTCRPQLGRFHKEIHANTEKEGQARGKIIHCQPSIPCGFYIFQPVCQRKGQLLYKIGSGFLHMIAGDGNGIEFRHILGGMGNNIRYDPHGWGRGIDIGIAHHKFF